MVGVLLLVLGNTGTVNVTDSRSPPGEHLLQRACGLDHRDRRHLGIRGDESDAQATGAMSASLPAACAGVLRGASCSSPPRDAAVACSIRTAVCRWPG